MFDPAQFLILLFVLILTVVFIVLAIQVYFILKEIRVTLSKANKVLDNTGQITESVSAPISSLSSILSGLKTGAAFAKILKKIDEKDE